MKSSKKKMEIEDLAVIVKHGFDAVYERFEEMEHRFNNKIDGVEEGLNNKIDGVEEGLNNKIDGLGLRISSYSSNCDKNSEQLNEWVGDLDKRVNKIEDKIVRVK